MARTAWDHHARLLDALHDALDGAERLSPLNDGPALNVLDGLLADAGRAIGALRGEGAGMSGFDRRLIHGEQCDDVS